MPSSPSDRATGDPYTGVYDLAVIGAGCAGLAGAVTASERGLSVALLDTAGRIGGQFYRHPAPAVGAVRPEALHHDWSAFADLRHRLVASGIVHLAGHHVWTMERHDGAETRFTIHAVTGADGDGERPVRVRARAVLLATGAYERQLPFPGWTLPGVVGAAGAQAMLKAGLVLPGRRVVVAGSGPLLLAVAASLATAGARVPAVVEASGYLGYARRPAVLAANPQKLAEAVIHGTALLGRGVRLRTRSAVTQVHGTDRVEAVTVSRVDRDWRPVRGTGRRVVCDALAVGHGLVPQTELATGLGCATRRVRDGTCALALDPLQRTSVPGLWAAGETGGIGGARLARVEGEIAGIAVAAHLRGGSGPEHGGRVRELQRRRERMRAFAGAMAAVHAPGKGWAEWLDDATEVCRCEEVTAGAVREAVDAYGARDARTAKLLTRAGMGWCQGRVCGAAVACLAAGDEPASPSPSPERRPLAGPVPLGVLGAIAANEPPAEPDDPAEQSDGTRPDGAAGPHDGEARHP